MPGAFDSLSNWETNFTELTTTAETTCYTVPNAYQAVYVTQIRCVHKTAQSAWVTLVLRRDSTDWVLAYRANIPSGGCPYDAPFLPLVVKKGEVIKAQTDRPGVQVMVSFAVQARPT